MPFKGHELTFLLSFVCQITLKTGKQKALLLLSARTQWPLTKPNTLNVSN